MFTVSSFNLKKPAFLTETLPQLKDQLKSTFSQPILASFHSIKRKTQQFQDDQPLVFLQVGSKVWEGVPKNMRAELWLSVLQRKDAGVGSEAMDKYEEMLASDVKPITATDIDKDVPRTLPNTKMFHSQEGQSALRRVLRAYAAYDPEVGYCQGMNFLAGLLLLHLSEERAFGAMVLVMFERGFRLLYQHNMSLLQIQLWQLGQLMPYKLRTHLESCGVVPVLFAAPWLLTCFSADFPVSFSSRILDMVLSNCMVSPLLRVAVVLLKRCEKKLRTLPDMEDILMFLKLEVPAWEEAELHEVLTDAFNKDWHERHKVVLGNTDGVETIAQAMARVHAVPEEQGENPGVENMAGRGTRTESNVAQADPATDLSEPMAELPLLQIRLPPPHSERHQEPTQCYQSIDGQKPATAGSVGSRSNSCFSFSDIECMSQSVHSPTQSEHSPSSVHSPHSDFWDPYLHDLRLFTMGEITELRNLSFNKTPRPTDHSGTVKSLVRSRSASAHCSLEGFLGSDGEDMDDDAAFFEVASRCGSRSPRRSSFPNRATSVMVDVVLPMSPSSTLSCPRTRLGRSSRDERSLLATGLGPGDQPALQPDGLTGLDRAASGADLVFGSPRSVDSAPTAPVNQDIARLLLSRPSFSCMSESEVMHSRAFPSAASLAMCMAAGSAVAEAIAMNRAANASITSSVCESENSMFTAQEASVMSANSQASSQGFIDSGEVSPICGNSSTISSQLQPSDNPPCNRHDGPSHTDSPDSLLDQLVGSAEGATSGSAPVLDMHPLDCQFSNAVTSDGSQSSAAVAVLESSTSLSLASPKLPGQRSRLSRCVVSGVAEGIDKQQLFAGTAIGCSHLLSSENEQCDREDVWAPGSEATVVKRDMLPAGIATAASAAEATLLRLCPNVGAAPVSSGFSTCAFKVPATPTDDARLTLDDAFATACSCEVPRRVPTAEPAMHVPSVAINLPALKNQGEGRKGVDLVSHPTRVSMDGWQHSPAGLGSSCTHASFAGAAWQPNSPPAPNQPISGVVIASPAATSQLNAASTSLPAAAGGVTAAVGFSPRRQTADFADIDMGLPQPSSPVPMQLSAIHAQLSSSPSLSATIPPATASKSPASHAARVSTESTSLQLCTMLSGDNDWQITQLTGSTTASAVSECQTALLTGSTVAAADADVARCSSSVEVQPPGPGGITDRSMRSTRDAGGDNVQPSGDTVSEKEGQGSEVQLRSSSSDWDVFVGSIATATAAQASLQGQAWLSSSSHSAPSHVPTVTGTLATCMNVGSAPTPLMHSSLYKTGSAVVSYSAGNTVASSMGSGTPLSRQLSFLLQSPCRNGSTGPPPACMASGLGVISCAVSCASSINPQSFDPYLAGSSSLSCLTSLSLQLGTGGVGLPTASPSRTATVARGPVTELVSTLSHRLSASSIMDLPGPVTQPAAVGGLDSTIQMDGFASLASERLSTMTSFVPRALQAQPASQLPSQIPSPLPSQNPSQVPSQAHSAVPTRTNSLCTAASAPCSPHVSSSHIPASNSWTPDSTFTTAYSPSLPAPSFTERRSTTGSAKPPANNDAPALFASPSVQRSLDTVATRCGSGPVGNSNLSPSPSIAQQTSRNGSLEYNTQGVQRLSPHMSLDAASFFALESLVTTALLNAGSAADSPPMTGSNAHMASRPAATTVSDCSSVSSPAYSASTTQTSLPKSTASPPASLPSNLSASPDMHFQHQSGMATLIMDIPDQQPSQPEATVDVGVNALHRLSSSAIPAPTMPVQAMFVQAMPAPAMPVPAMPTSTVPSTHPPPCGLCVSIPMDCSDQPSPSTDLIVGSYGWLHTECPSITPNRASTLPGWPSHQAAAQPLTIDHTSFHTAMSEASSHHATQPDGALTPSTESTSKGMDTDDWLPLASPATISASVEQFYRTAGWGSRSEALTSALPNGSRGSQLKRQASRDPSSSPSHAQQLPIKPHTLMSSFTTDPSLTWNLEATQPHSTLQPHYQAGFHPSGAPGVDVFSVNGMKVNSHPLQSSIHSTNSSKQENTPSPAGKSRFTPFMPLPPSSEAAAAATMEAIGPDTKLLGASFSRGNKPCALQQDAGGNRRQDDLAVFANTLQRHSMQHSHIPEPETVDGSKPRWNHSLHVSMSSSPVQDTIFAMSPGHSPEPAMNSSSVGTADLLPPPPYLPGPGSTPGDGASPLQGQWYNAAPVMPTAPGSPTVASSFQSVDSFILVSPPAYASMRSLSGRGGTSPKRERAGSGGAAMFAALHARHRPKKSLDSQILENLNGFQANCSASAVPSQMPDTVASSVQPAAWHQNQPANSSSAENVEVLNERLSAFLSDVAEVL